MIKIQCVPTRRKITFLDLEPLFVKPKSRIRSSLRALSILSIQCLLRYSSVFFYRHQRFMGTDPDPICAQNSSGL